MKLFVVLLRMISMIRLIGAPSFLRKLQLPTMLSLLRPAPAQWILDVGCGRMALAIAIARESNDSRVGSLDIALRTRDAKRAVRHGVLSLIADAHSLPFADRSVDSIVASSLLQMVPDPARLLGECRRVLRPGGTILLSVPNHYQFIPGLLTSIVGPVVRGLLALPNSFSDLTRELDTKFGVHGPTGYYSREELTDVLASAGFMVTDHRYSPGWLGSFLWELGVLGYLRFGGLSFHLLIFAYPIARLYDIAMPRASKGSEHIIRAVRIP